MAIKKWLFEWANEMCQFTVVMVSCWGFNDEHNETGEKSWLGFDLIQCLDGSGCGHAGNIQKQIEGTFTWEACFK